VPDDDAGIDSAMVKDGDCIFRKPGDGISLASLNHVIGVTPLVEANNTKAICDERFSNTIKRIGILREPMETENRWPSSLIDHAPLDSAHSSSSSTAVAS
jgi:hypothetical protein